ncbi:MAG: WhiB family transcriptional regulator, redox-sensing transcriptional regulator [Acidimicrobiaceae bacterium]|nr:WhiB family transcriptional regulator, redox-sensing transcriptional regulator [Acidimicrobiaceae bacterium]MDQ1445685.1 WhiB family transcriptional regulator, redox-sensing transcriptional regulator [Acidimicrobiaceae bacterium]
MALAEAAVVGTWDVEKWRAESACRYEDVNLFFPAGVTGPAEHQIKQAKAICARCPVRDTCLAFAIETNQEYGVWGGTTEDERRVLRRAWRARRAALKAVS